MLFSLEISFSFTPVIAHRNDIQSAETTKVRILMLPCDSLKQPPHA